MRRKILTAKRVEALKPEPGQKHSVDVPDGIVPGLSLVLHPSGSKSWALRYRFNGKQKRLTLKDRFPKMKLAEARRAAGEMLDGLDEGKDPAGELDREPEAFENVVEEFIERYAKRNKSWAETQRLLEKEAVSIWRGRNVADIGRADLLRVLDGIADRGAPYGANRTLAALRKLFSWAVERGIVADSPAAGVRAPAPERSRQRVLDDAELLEVWRAAEAVGYPGGPFVHLLILTGQRRGEAAGLRWRDVDREAGLWTLPPEMTKANRVHDVALSGAALELLDGLPEFAEGDFIFTTTGGRRPISGFSALKKTLDAAIAKAREADGLDEMAGWRYHDIRRSVATGLARMGTPPHVLSAILNHSPGSTQGVTHIYNRFKYHEERRAALEAWADYVAELVERSKAARAS